MFCLIILPRYFLLGLIWKKKIKVLMFKYWRNWQFCTTCWGTLKIGRMTSGWMIQLWIRSWSQTSIMTSFYHWNECLISVQDECIVFKSSFRYVFLIWSTKSFKQMKNNLNDHNIWRALEVKMNFKWYCRYIIKPGREEENCWFADNDINGWDKFFLWH